MKTLIINFECKAFICKEDSVNNAYITRLIISVPASNFMTGKFGRQASGYKIELKMENVLFDYLAKYLMLTAEEKKAILKLDVFKQYKKGAILLKHGQLSDYGYFVIKGCIRCSTPIAWVTN